MPDIAGNSNKIERRENTSTSPTFYSNQSISPEDIGELIAKTDSEDLQETMKKFQEEEKTPVPDVSNLNRPLGPEDIAALIANL